MSTPQERQLADTLNNALKRIEALEKGTRPSQLGNSSLEDSAIRAYDRNGTMRKRDGKQSDGRFAVTYANGPEPARPTAPVVAGRELSLVVYWDGQCLDSQGETIDPPTDVQRVDVHVSETEGFSPSSDTLSGSLIAESVISIAVDANSKFVTLVAVSTSDVPSAASDQVSAQSPGASFLSTVVLDAARIFVPTSDPDQWHLEIGDPSKPLHWLKSGESGFYVEQDAATGRSNTFVSGEVQFGMSRLANDVVHLDEVDTTGFETPSVRQRTPNGSSGDVGSISVTWPQATTQDSLLVAVVTSGATDPDAVTAPSGWTLLNNAGIANASALSVTVFYAVGASRSGTETFTNTATFDHPMSASLLEITGIDPASPLDVHAVAEGASSTVDSGSVATTQANQAWLAVHAWGKHDQITGWEGYPGQFTDMSSSNAGSVLHTEVAAQNVTSTGTASVQRDLTFPGEVSDPSWLGMIATFNAAPAALPPTPNAGSAKLYAGADGNGTTNLHAINPAGVVTQLSGARAVGVRLENAISQDLNSQTDTRVWLNQPFWGPNNITLLTNNDVVQVDEDGIYLLSGAIRAPSSNAQKTLMLGSGESTAGRPYYTQNSGNAPDLSISTAVNLNAGDLVELWAWSEVATTILAEFGRKTHLSVVKLGEL